jgi:hypothetical protein
VNTRPKFQIICWNFGAGNIGRRGRLWPFKANVLSDSEKHLLDSKETTKLIILVHCAQVYKAFPFSSYCLFLDITWIDRTQMHFHLLLWGEVASWNMCQLPNHSLFRLKVLAAHSQIRCVLNTTNKVAKPIIFLSELSNM